VRTRVGIPYNLVETNEDPHPKSCNCLDIPLSYDPFVRQRYASEVAAWKECIDRPYCKRVEQVPTTDIRWAIAGTSEAYSKFHIDTAGFLTFVVPDSGLKLWVLATPKDNENRRPFEQMGNVDILLDHFDLDMPNPEFWDFDLVVLTPGTML
jgi:hypothetical protein